MRALFPQRLATLPICTVGRRSPTMKALAAVAVSLLLITGWSASAQNRVNDKDIQIMMNNIKSDSGRFRTAFKNSVKKTTIRHTSREKDSKNLVTNFKARVDGMYQTFRSTKKADTALPLVIDTASQIDKLLREISFDEATNSSWAKVKTELKQLADAYGIQDTVI
jgi:hypothetical protein